MSISSIRINNRVASTLQVGNVIAQSAYYGQSLVFTTFDLATLFNNGEQGAWYDPSDLSTLFQDDAGTTPVTEPGQTVGLMLDKRLGLTLNANIADHAVGPLGSSSSGRGTVTPVGNGYWECETTSIAGSNRGVFFASEQDFLEFGAVYEIEVDIQSLDAPTPGTKNIQFAVAGTQEGDQDYIADKREAIIGTYKFKLRAINEGKQTILFTTQDGWGVGDKITIKVSVRELPGNHATQPTAESRPVYQAGGGLHWLEFDGVDDQLRFPDGLVGEGTWSFAMAYQPDGNNFLMLHRGSSNPWVGVGEKDSTSTSISGSGASKNAFYVNNVADTSGTRGGQYSAAQGGSRLLVDFNTSTTWSPNAKIGSYSGGSFTTPGDVYAMLLIDRSLTEDERGLVDNYLAGRVSA